MSTKNHDIKWLPTLTDDDGPIILNALLRRRAIANQIQNSIQTWKLNHSSYHICLKFWVRLPIPYKRYHLLHMIMTSLVSLEAPVSLVAPVSLTAPVTLVHAPVSLVHAPVSLVVDVSLELVHSVSVGLWNLKNFDDVIQLRLHGKNAKFWIITNNCPSC